MGLTELECTRMDLMEEQVMSGYESVVLPSYVRDILQVFKEVIATHSIYRVTDFPPS